MLPLGLCDVTGHITKPNLNKDVVVAGQHLMQILCTFLYRNAKRHLVIRSFTEHAQGVINAAAAELAN